MPPVADKSAVAAINRALRVSGWIRQSAWSRPTGRGRVARGRQSHVGPLPAPWDAINRVPTPMGMPQTRPSWQVVIVLAEHQPVRLSEIQ